MISDEVRGALELGSSPNLEDRTIDITTTGRRSGQPRRIEIVFYRFDGDTYLSGIPAPRERDWLRNLREHPEFTFHLKHVVRADLPAVAEVITDETERRRVLGHLVEEYNARWDPASGWPEAVLDEWVSGSPLAKVSFEDPAH